MATELKKALAERMLGAEMDVHLGDAAERQAGNHRNGSSPKTVDTGSERIVLDIPRDRQGRFDPVLIRKYQRRFPGFDDKIIAMYARGMSTRDIQAHIEELYGIGVSAALVSAITDAVLEDVTAWQNRPLEPVYAIVYFDALRVKIRDEGLVRNKAVYLAIDISCHGDKEVLGLWLEQTEGAKFWHRVMNELKARGTEDLLIAVVDGLKGLSGGDHDGVSGLRGSNLHISPIFVARAWRRRGGGPHGLKNAEGIADTMSKRLEGVRPVTASGSAAAAEDR